MRDSVKVTRGSHKPSLRVQVSLSLPTRKAMKILIVLLVIFISGCSTASIHTNKDDCTASYSSLLKSSSLISIGACGAKGEATDSKTDEELAKDIISVLRSK